MSIYRRLSWPGLIHSIIVGILSGFIFYLIPTKLLISDSLMASFTLSPEWQQFLLMQTLHYGIPIGVVSGWAMYQLMTSELPQGFYDLYTCILTYFISIITALITNYSFIETSSYGKLALSLLVVIVCPFIIIPGIILVAKQLFKIGL